MMRLAPLSLCLCVLVPSFAGAEEVEQLQSEEQWLRELRNSGTYKKGMDQAHKKIDFAYDLGAVEGAKHWDTIHDYYIELARAKGCKKGIPYAEGPIKTCHRVVDPQPKLVSTGYQSGKARITAEAAKTDYPHLVRRVLFVIYDFGYVQGMKHRLRANNDNIRWKQAYYRSCMLRANDAEHEPLCSKASNGWAESLLDKLAKQIEAHGLPAGKKPQ